MIHDRWEITVGRLFIVVYLERAAVDIEMKRINRAFSTAHEHLDDIVVSNRQ